VAIEYERITVVLKIGRSAVRPRPWPLYLTCANDDFLDLFLRVSSQLSARDFFAVPVENGSPLTF
jgi:hypothetical protein